MTTDIFKYAHIVGWGKYLPDNVVTNDDLAQSLGGTTANWIESLTGICERRIASTQDSTASLGVKAAKKALNQARIDPSAVDLVVVATLSPDHIMPATACLIQESLGTKNAAAFDLNAGCTGFVYALALTATLIRAGQAKVAVVVGSDTVSRLVDWEDRSTCVLFGDGAGAVVLQASDEPGGILSTVLGADGAGSKHLIVPAGGSRMPADIRTIEAKQHFIKMNGPEVFRFTSHIMPQVTMQVCVQANIALDDVSLLIPHQANARIIQSATKHLGFDQTKIFTTLHRYGNTCCASIPITLCEAIENGYVKDQDYFVLVGFGAGLTWGATVIQWTCEKQPNTVTNCNPVPLAFQQQGVLTDLALKGVSHEL
ncbi:MAG: ketoacyl-ACP synthase III [Anaerolineae bacterium]|nr:ketoacyl-ACP synthase III [Anaerolineae bacterium]